MKNKNPEKEIIGLNKFKKRKKKRIKNKNLHNKKIPAFRAHFVSLQGDIRRCNQFFARNFY